MKDNRRNRIEELKLVQKQRQFAQMLESKNYPPYLILSANANEEIWNKINQGRVIEKVKKINLESLQKNIDQIFSGSEKLGTILHLRPDSFIVQFDKMELIQYANKMIEDLSKDALLYWFVFSIDLNQILLLDESEYGYYELTYYEEDFK